jgi:DeoR/GlpR family transcriptional regulator of sugar metabolism
MAAKLFREERLQLIMEKIYKEKKIVVKDLADEFNRSLPSIRLDLAELGSRGLINRTHGGAILADTINNNYIASKSFLQLREETKKIEKQRIAKAVMDLINDGDSIMIDGGSSTYYVAKCLSEKRGLTIITTSYHMLPILLEIPDAKIYLTGGLIHRDYEDLIGDITVDAIQRFKPSYCILGIDGISIKHGLTTTDPLMANIKKRMISVSEKVIIVSDSTKFGKVCLMHVANVDEMYAIVTDTDIPGDMVEPLRALNTKLIQA